MNSTMNSTTTKELIEDFNEKISKNLEYGSFISISDKEKYSQIDELIKNLNNIKKQIKINNNNQYFQTYLQNQPWSIQKENCLNMLGLLNVEATNKFDTDEGWNTTTETIKITAKFKDGIEVACKIERSEDGNSGFSKPTCNITLLNHSRKNPKMWEHKRKNQKKKDYCIVKDIYYVGSKEEKNENHWTYLLNKIKSSINFVEFFNNLEKI